MSSATVYITFAAAKNLNRNKKEIWGIINQATLKRSEMDIRIDCDHKVGCQTRRGVEMYVPVFVTGVNEWVVDKACEEIRRIVGRRSFEWNIERSLSPPSQRATSCEEKTIEESIFIKSFATKNLNSNHGRKVKSRILNSFDVKINYSLSRKIRSASDGEVYVQFHLTGKSKTGIQKAVVLIQDVVGKDNVEQEIELPSHMIPSIPTPVADESPSQRISNNNNSMNDSSAPVELVVGIAIVSFIFVGVFSVCRKAYSYIHLWWNNVNFGKVYLNLMLIIKWGALILALYYIIVVVRKLFGSYQAKRIEELKLYRAKKIKQTVHVKSSKSKSFTGNRGRKLKGWIMNNSGVDDIQLEQLSGQQSHMPVYLLGSRQAVQKAIELIHKSIGIENVSSHHVKEEYVSTDDQPLRSPPQPQTTNSSTAAAAHISTDSEPQPNREDSVPEDRGNIQSNTTEAGQNNANSMPGTEAASQQEENTIQDDIVAESEATAVENYTPLTTELVEDEALPISLEQPQPIKDNSNHLTPEQDCVPTEIGIDSTRGITTRETITESSVSSFNDGSKASKTLSTFALNDNDPLLIFLRSQHTCIRGSVDDFYTWLVKSEYIDSMTALKEAVSDDDYYNDTMKVGSGSSGIKVFKRKVFKRALSEYEDDVSKEPTTTNLPEPPEELVCPISLVLMTNDPVLAADGITYERVSIEDWFKKSKAKISEAREKLMNNQQSESDQRVVDNGVCSPVYGSKLKSLTLMPNTGTRNMARAYKEKLEVG